MMNPKLTPVVRSGSDQGGWTEQIRSIPAKLCPTDRGLALFVAQPLAIEGGSYAHVIGGCDRCRVRLQRLLLGAASAATLGARDQSESATGPVSPVRMKAAQ